jgi:hypothetical protein
MSYSVIEQAFEQWNFTTTLLHNSQPVHDFLDQLVLQIENFLG